MTPGSKCADPITEKICGVDLIAATLRVAEGEPLPYRQDDIRPRGHAIEVRINSEDPERDFMPAPGTIADVRWPAGPGVRVDSMVYAGYQIPPYYDSMIGKLIVWAEDRDRALARLGRALSELELTGLKTTLPFFERVLPDPRRRTQQHRPHHVDRAVAGSEEPMTGTRYTLGGDEHLFAELSERVHWARSSAAS